jgi:hypothetical protein
LGFVGLGKGCRPDGIRCEPGEDITNWATEILFDLQNNRFDGCRGHLVLQSGQFVNDLRWQQVDPCADELAQLNAFIALSVWQLTCFIL